MAVRILSDLDKWQEVAEIDTGKGWETRPEAYAYVVLGAMYVRMPDLTEATAEKWLTRLRAWEVIDGPLLRRHDPDTDTYVGVPVTMDALRPYFGTRTNVFPAESDAKFKRALGEAVLQRAADRLAYERREQEAEKV